MLSTPLSELEDCCLCPRNCHANRLKNRTGYCKSNDSFNIASVCIHRGEEPAVSGKEGICNIFFTNCNLQCIYCQNHQISDNRISRTFSQMALEEVTKRVAAILDQGIRRVGFVSPSHFIPQMKAIIVAMGSLGYKPKWIYNTNGYDKAETIRSLEGLIDVYLPDLKYMDPALSKAWSGAADYPDMATKAIREMYRQKGSTLITDEEGGAETGLIIRHLVLPGQVENSLSVLRFIAGELSPRIHISLMSQYYPTPRVSGHPLLGRTISGKEYERIMEEMEKLGMDRGWIQEFDSNYHYRPDFEQEHPFESNK
ncbi:MAG: 4Fe-4S cluster-binding domain-containing protein [Bacteroidales bacterium]|nr:4Fe-4S cluster-binding domain-containing protein [Bacteroidales bacterium]